MSRMPTPEEMAGPYRCFGHYGFDPPRCEMCGYQNACASLVQHIHNTIQQRRSQPPASNYPHIPPPPAIQPPAPHNDAGGVHYHYHFYGTPPAQLPGMMPQGHPSMPSTFPVPHNPVQYNPAGPERESVVEELAKYFLTEAMKRLMNRG